MQNSSGDKPTFQERLNRTFRSLTITYLVLMPPCLVATAVICRNQAPYNEVPFAVLIFLALIFGASLALVLGYVGARFARWMCPTELDPKKTRVAFLSIVILALLVSWAGWRDVPTNAQIDAVHNDPRFAAAIAEMHEKQMNPDLLLHAMSREDRQVSRYVLFAVETGAMFIVLLVLFGAYWIIVKAVSWLFGIKDHVTETISK